MGSLLSMALAKGCTSSGQRGSHAQSAEPHLAQKWRLAGLFRPPIFAWNVRTFFLPRTRSEAVAALSLNLTSEEIALLEEPYVPHAVAGYT